MIANAIRENKVNPLVFNTEETVNQREEKGVYFSEYEWNVFKKEMELGKNIETALNNARYYGKLKRSIDNLESGRNTITFTDEEWRKMLNEEDI